MEATKEKTAQDRREYERNRRQNPERKEYRRLREQERRKRAKELGHCRDCSKPSIPGQTRYPTCAEKHRESRRRSDAERRAATKGEIIEGEIAHMAIRATAS